MPSAPIANRGRVAASVTIREISEDWREDELHHREHEAEPAAVHGRAAKALAGELHQATWDRPALDDESGIATGIQQQRHGDKGTSSACLVLRTGAAGVTSSLSGIWMARRYRWLVLHPARLGELLHHPLLLLRQLLGNLDRHLDDQVALLVALLDSLTSHAESFPRRSSRRNLDRHLFPSSVRTLILVPSVACAMLSGTVAITSSPSRR